MKMNYKNKKARMVLRDVVFMIIIFSGIIALSSIFVGQMGNTYDNTEMVSSYNQEVIGEDTLSSTGNTWESIAEDLSGKNGVVTMLTGGLRALGVIILEVIKAPATFSTMLTSTLDILGVSENFQNIAGIILTSILYILIIFAIAKVFLRGGDI